MNKRACKMRGKWIYTAKETGERFAEKRLLPGQRKGAELVVDTKKRYQKIYGFGGAFTDTAASALWRMDASLQKEALRAYFDRENGLCYNMGRIPIGGCDFSSVPYSHAEVPGDSQLMYHSIDQDQKGIIPLIRRAKACRQEAENAEPLLLYALPWSPPGWMKTNGKMNWGGRLLPQYYSVMASYLIKFIRAYEKEGIQLWGLAAQNEPVEVQRWPSCEYTGEEERNFLKEYLIPALDRAGYGDKKLLFWDCNKDFLRKRAEEVLSDQVLRNRIFGAAFHWYSGDYFEELQKVHEQFPQIRLLSTECCVVMPKRLDDWSVGERYAHDIIGDLNHWTCAWMDWNLYLDQNSGPGIADNPCAAPIILDAHKQEIIWMSSYYYIGHFSRYIRRGARRLDVKKGGEGGKRGRDLENEKEETALECCAFLNPDKTVAVIVMNASDDPINGQIHIGDTDVDLQMDPHSIGTLLLDETEYV